MVREKHNLAVDPARPRAGEQLADHWEAFAEGHGSRGEGVTQVLDADFSEAGRQLELSRFGRCAALS